MKVKNHKSKRVNYPLIDMVNPTFWGYDFDSTNAEKMHIWTRGHKSSSGRGTKGDKGFFDKEIFFPYDPENRKKHFHGVHVEKDRFVMKTMTRT